MHPSMRARIEKIERERANKAVTAKYKLGEYNDKRVQESMQEEPLDAPVIRMTPPTELINDYENLINNINAMIVKQNESLQKLKETLNRD